MELVTVYISTYNRLSRLKRALESVQKQTYKNIEILVSDDCSNDGTNDFMMKYCNKHSNTRYLRNERNSGACITRNNAIFSARGKFITGLDDDDEFTEDRISCFIDKWDDKYSFICANFIEKYPEGLNQDYYNVTSDTINSYKSLLFENIASNQVFTLTKNLIGIGGFSPQVKRLQDWDTWLRLSYKYGDFLYLNKTLYVMHHDHNFNESRVSSSYSLTNAIEDFLIRNKEIFGSDYKRRKCYVDYLNYRLTLFNAIYWSYIEKDFRNFLRFFYQKFKKR